MDLVLTRITVERLLAHAAAAARLVGHVDEGVPSAFVEELGDHVDAIVHELSELLGDPVLSHASPTGKRLRLTDPTVAVFDHDRGDER